MTKTDKIVFIVFGLLAFIGLVLIINSFIQVNKEHKKDIDYINKNCPHDYWGVGGDFIDCKNSLLIERIADQDVIFVQDIKNYSFNNKIFIERIAPIYAHKFVDDDLYLILNPDEEKYYNFDLYYQEILINGEIKKISFDSKEEVSIYRKVNSVNGNNTLYSSFEDIPDSEKEIFRELDKR